MFIPFLLALASAVPATAAAPVAVVARAPADPVALAAADRLLEVIDFQKAMNNTIDGMLAGQRERFAEELQSHSDEPVPAELIDRLHAVLGDHLRTMLRAEGPRLRQATALLYAQTFTAAELDRLTAIQRDPVMQKSLRVMPELMNESMNLARGVFAQSEPALKEKIEAAVKDYAATHEE